MALPDEPQVAACLRAMLNAILEARLLGLHGKSNGLTRDECARLADLMEAVHNLPEMVQRWETVNEGWIREDLAAYDEKWGSKSVLKLLPDYMAILTRPVAG